MIFSFGNCCSFKQLVVFQVHCRKTKCRFIKCCRFPWGVVYETFVAAKAVVIFISTSFSFDACSFNKFLPQLCWLVQMTYAVERTQISMIERSRGVFRNIMLEPWIYFLSFFLFFPLINCILTTLLLVSLALDSLHKKLCHIIPSTIQSFPVSTIC